MEDLHACVLGISISFGKMGELITMLSGLKTLRVSKTMHCMGIKIPHKNGNF